MSGGSHNYLCYAPIHELMLDGRINDMEEMEQTLIKRLEKHRKGGAE